MFGWLRKQAASADPAPPSLHDELARLETSADHASPSARAHIFNRAGDLCAQANERDLAQGYYGRGIDEYLEANAFDYAAALCRKLIRYSPQVVRAHCTLAFLSVRNHHDSEAEAALEDYVMATKRSRTQRFAIPRLRLMADATQDAEVRRLIANALRELQDHEGAEQVLSQLVRDPSDPDSAREPEHWDRLLRAAVMDPQELWERCWINYNSYRSGQGDQTDLERSLTLDPGADRLAPRPRRTDHWGSGS